jgi:guanidinopropionase
MAELTEQQASDTAMAYWHWSGVATFLRCAHRPDMSETDIGLIGFPYSGGNAIERMQYLAPRAVRNRSTSYHRVLRGTRFDPFTACRVSDLGDVPLVNMLNPDRVTEEAAEFYRRVDALGIVPITVGGDHSVTTPILRAIAGPSSRRKEPIGMIHFDAHADSWPAANGTRYHAGAAFRIGVEEGLIDPARTVQIGWHGAMGDPGMDDFSREHFRIFTLDDVVKEGVNAVAKEVRRVVGEGPTYVSVDLDVLDLAYAPAVADPEVNGLTSREFFGLIERFEGVDVCGADIVCYCPPLDNPGQITALTSSALLLHFVSLAAQARVRAQRGVRGTRVNAGSRAA